MDKISFLLDTDNYFYARITKETEHAIRLVFDKMPDDAIVVSGFEILNENNNFSMSGDYYYRYNTIFRKIDNNTILLSDDGSVYVEIENNVTEAVEKELTEEELAIIEKQNKIYELTSKIKSLKDDLSETDYVIIKCQEYLLVGKELPSEYDISSYNEQRDAIRTQINELEAELVAMNK